MALSLFKASTGLIGTVAFAFGGVGATGGISRPYEITFAYYLSLFSGTYNDKLIAFAVPVFGLGVGLFLIFAVREVLSKGYNRIATQFYDGDCFPRACTDGDIPKIVKCAESYFSTATDLSQTLDLHRMDPSIFTIYETSEGGFIGYSCIVRLTRSGVASIKRGQFSISNIPLEYVRRDTKHQGCDVYIGAICCTRLFMRGFVLGRVYGNIESMKPKTIYARAATEDGLRILKRRKFSALHHRQDGIGHVFYLKA